MKQSTLGSRIRTLRIQNQMTQVQLAARVGVTDKAVSKWERDLSYPDIALFPRLADVLGVTVNDLLLECAEECRPSRLLRAFEMSRDIRAPLHFMLGLVEIAKNYYNEPEKLQRYLKGIRISGKRILIAEDVAINREIAAEILHQTGAETEFAENGRVCLEMVEAAPAGGYDLILMDLMMPEMDGLEAARRIRALPDREKASVPIIALTTNVDEKDRKAAFEAGMDAFTEKPIFVDRLFGTMGKYLHREVSK